ncbi:UDP-galactose:(galactosyl) LPS alpha1,2-galactosyltransferase WaaW [Streptococcus gallolyticus]|uniref:UDP-galactose:(Galactosyl) LPS alpha1,2-galactosyltransferase WaaW n=1 Tax=Streptococcus gallolyticus TaxID=315405 RepID=A0AA94M0Z5_9STRE|nr:glycosyltransferase [Streptococcus gallolyticus]AQP41289.1 lipopolysaccharide biosynthesisglycosyltransferase [Streptococcus gallolyticus subsp. gallolyticus DSM 16831]SQG78568.1 UDP-galactose:(galactosyl) LPS alpha1,2-galactosyltransferase WaaW [Streptococcus gallolyticus]
MQHILYCGDSQMIDGLILSSLSLAKNTNEALDIRILTARIESAEKTYHPLTEDSAVKLEKILQAYDERHCVTIIDISDLLLSEFPVANQETIFTPNCMLRLFADKLSDLPERFLYLDTDVICCRDFSEFYHQELNDVEFVGVLDYYGKWFFHHQWRTFDYINSGVLLFNTAEIQKTNLLGRCRKLCQEKTFFMPDQSALNTLAKKKKITNRKFNDQRRYHKNTVFQHFTTSFRFFPWVHTLTVKPWEIDKMHDVLKLHVHDDLIDQYLAYKEDFLY